MPLYDLLSPKPDKGKNINAWTFSHAEQHNEVAKAIQSQKGINLFKYVLDPFNKEDEQGWDLRHQQAHNDVNTALNFIGNDLSTRDLSTEQGRLEWAALHFREHQQWNQALGI